MDRIAEMLQQHVLELRFEMRGSSLIFAQLDLAPRGLEVQMPALLVMRADHLPARVAAQCETAPRAVFEGCLAQRTTVAHWFQSAATWSKLTASSACAMSSTMSSMCSKPTETRTSPGVTPALACSSAESWLCVVLAG